MMTELNILAERFLKIMLSFFDMVFLNKEKNAAEDWNLS